MGRSKCSQTKYTVSIYGERNKYIDMDIYFNYLKKTGRDFLYTNVKLYGSA